MKRGLAIIVSLLTLSSGPLFHARAAEEQWRWIRHIDTTDEAQESLQIAQLSAPDPQARDAACAHLKLIGTARCIPALAALLTDNQLSHSARHALESMPYPEAGAALLAALGKTSGSNQVGIINSLAMRHEADATPQLVPLMASSDSDVAVAAAEALGRIGGAQAITPLEAAVGGSAGAVHRAQIDALLACANRLLTEGTQELASGIFQRIYTDEKTDGWRLAAFRGLILASGPRGIALMTEAIAGPDAPSQGAALQLAAAMKDPAATQALADLLPKVRPAVQIALLQCLGQRGDPSAAPSVAQMATNQNADVRVMAITALGDLGDGSVALLLAVRAAAGAAVERDAARLALRDLRRGPVTPALLAALADPEPAVQLEVIAALGNRGDQSAVPKILQLTQDQPNVIRSAAFQALAILAAPAQIPDLVQLVMGATNEDARSQAADTLGLICQRRQSKLTLLDVQPVLTAVQTAPVEARVALMPVCAALTHAWAREALRAAMEDRDPQVREAGLRALCETHDPALLADLVNVACRSDDKKARVLAVRGCARIVKQEEGGNLSNAQKLEVLKRILDTSLDDQEKRLVLSALSAVPDEQSLALAMPMLGDAAVGPEAARAVIRIADSISTEHPAEAAAALRRVLAMPATGNIRQSAQSALKKIK